MEGIETRGDIVVLTTARPEEFRSLTEKMLKDFGPLVVLMSVEFVMVQVYLRVIVIVLGI